MKVEKLLSKIKRCEVSFQNNLSYLGYPVLLQSYLNFSTLVIFSQKEEIKINDWFCWQATAFFSSAYSHASQNVFKAKSSASCEKHSTIVKWVSSTFFKRAISHNKKKLGLKKKIWSVWLCTQLAAAAFPSTVYASLDLNSNEKIFGW